MIADEIIACLKNQLKSQEVTEYFPVLGRRLFIRELTPKQRIEWLNANGKDPDSSDARLILMSLVDESGNPVFSKKHLEFLTGDEIGTGIIVKLAQIALQVSDFFFRPSSNGHLITQSNEVPQDGGKPPPSS